MEFGNIIDPYAVAVTRDGIIVGHIPRIISAMCFFFLPHGGQIICQINGPRRYSRDLVQGGLEVPCTLTFFGTAKKLGKVKRLLDKAAGVKVPQVSPTGSDDASHTDSQPSSKKLKQEDIDSTVTECHTST